MTNQQSINSTEYWQNRYRALNFSATRARLKEKITKPQNQMRPAKIMADESCAFNNLSYQLPCTVEEVVTSIETNAEISEQFENKNQEISGGGQLKQDLVNQNRKLKCVFGKPLVNTDVNRMESEYKISQRNLLISNNVIKAKPLFKSCNTCHTDYNEISSKNRAIDCSDVGNVCGATSKELIESISKTMTEPRSYVCRQPSIKIPRGTVQEGTHLWRKREMSNVLQNSRSLVDSSFGGDVNRRRNSSLSSEHWSNIFNEKSNKNTEPTLFVDNIRSSVFEYENIVNPIAPSTIPHNSDFTSISSSQENVSTMKNRFPIKRILSKQREFYDEPSTSNQFSRNRDGGETKYLPTSYEVLSACPRAKIMVVSDAKLIRNKNDYNTSECFVGEKKLYWDKPVFNEFENNCFKKSANKLTVKYSDSTDGDENLENGQSYYTGSDNEPNDVKPKRARKLSRNISVQIKSGTVRNLISAYKTDFTSNNSDVIENSVSKIRRIRKSKISQASNCKQNRLKVGKPVTRTLSVVIPKGTVRATLQFYENNASFKNHTTDDDLIHDCLSTYTKTERELQDIHNEIDPINAQHCHTNKIVDLSDSRENDGITRSTVTKDFKRGNSFKNEFDRSSLTLSVKPNESTNVQLNNATVSNFIISKEPSSTFPQNPHGEDSFEEREANVKHYEQQISGRKAIREINPYNTGPDREANKFHTLGCGGTNSSLMEVAASLQRLVISRGEHEKCSILPTSSQIVKKISGAVDVSCQADDDISMKPETETKAIKNSFTGVGNCDQISILLNSNFEQKRNISEHSNNSSPIEAKLKNNDYSYNEGINKFPYCRDDILYSDFIGNEIILDNSPGLLINIPNALKIKTGIRQIHCYEKKINDNFGVRESYKSENIIESSKLNETSSTTEQQTRLNSSSTPCQMSPTKTVTEDLSTTSSIPENLSTTSSIPEKIINAKKGSNKTESSEIALVKAYGGGLYHGTVGRQNTFFLDTSMSENGELAVLVVGPEHDCVTNTTICATDATADTLRVHYTPHVNGRYTINIVWDDVIVPGSPYLCTVVDSQS